MVYNRTMQKDILPSCFGELVNQVNNVRRKSSNEFSSSCPYCLTGDDRFVLFVVGKGGFPFAFCRHDPENHRWYPAKDHKLTQSEIDEFRRNQIEVEKARIEASQRTIEILQNDKMWDFFHNQNSEWSRNTFREWGISDTWVNYLKLGFIPDHTINSVDGAYHSPAFSIPIWSVGGKVQNIKLRLANPKSGRDRYRNYYSTGRSFLFVPMYDLPIEGVGVVVEGEKKAIVMEQTIDDISYRVVGLQSKTPDEEVIKQLKSFEMIYLWLDPDSFTVEYDKHGKRLETANERMVRILGKERVRIVDCPVKSDDGILQGMNPMNFIRMARKA